MEGGETPCGDIPPEEIKKIEVEQIFLHNNSGSCKSERYHKRVHKMQESQSSYSISKRLYMLVRNTYNKVNFQGLLRISIY